jgi:hypothetical protein
MVEEPVESNNAAEFLGGVAIYLGRERLMFACPIPLTQP